MLEVDIVEEQERRSGIPVRFYYTDKTNKRVRIGMCDMEPEDIFQLLKLGEKYPQQIEVSVRPYNQN